MCPIFPYFLSRVLLCLPSPGLLALSSSTLWSCYPHRLHRRLTDLTPRAPLSPLASLSVKYNIPALPAEVSIYDVEDTNSHSQHGLRNENLHSVLYGMDYKRLRVGVRDHQMFFP